jgi:hypothetical protein
MFTLILVLAVVVAPFLIGLTFAGIQTYRNRIK